METLPRSLANHSDLLEGPRESSMDKTERQPTGTRRVNFPGLLGAAALLLVFSSGKDLTAQAYLLQIGELEVAPGEAFALPVEGDWIEPVVGFQLSIAYPTTAPIENLEITVANSLVGELQPEFIQFNQFPGAIVGGVLFEVIAPITGVSLPPVGFPLLICELTGTVVGDAEEQFIPYSLVDGLGVPPVNNTFVVATNSIPPSVMTDGGIDIVLPPPVQVFMRGDVNMDTWCDVGDAIFHLNYTFSGGPLPTCEDAGDANDDGHSDVSDAIYILLYIFNGGPAMSDPYPDPGPDPTEDNIDCEVGLDLP